jgi:uncharacterized protein
MTTTSESQLLSTAAERPSWLNRHPLLAFFVIAYAWTAGLIGSVVLALSAGLITQDSPLVTLAANLAPFGPTLAAVLMAAMRGRGGLAELLGSLDPRRVRLGWYVLALFGPPLAIISAATLVYGTTPITALVAQWPLVFTRYLPYTMTVALLGTGLAEELGWRGFAQPRMQHRYGPLAGSLVLGLLVGFWHTPNLVAGPGGPMQLALQILYTTIIALTFTFAYNRNRGSALIVALLHAALNTSGRLLASLVPIADVAQFQLTFFWLAIGVAAVVGALLVLLSRGRLGCTSPRDGETLPR